MSFDMNKFKEKLITIDSIALLYILIVGGLCHILPIPEMIKGFLALPGFLIIPYLVGNLFAPLNFFENNAWQSKVSRGIISWMLGLILLVIGAIMFVKIFDIIYYMLLIFVVIAVKILTIRHHPINDQVKILGYLKRNYMEIIILVLIISFPLILIKSVSPFPLDYTIDPFHFSIGAHQVMDHSSITQGGGYFPFLEIIVGILSIIYNINPFTLFWTGAFFSYSALPIGIYLLMYQVSKNKKFSLIAALFAIFPACYNATWAMVLNYFIPQIWIYFTFPFALFIIYKILSQSPNQLSTKSFIKLGFVLFLIFFLTYEFSMSFLPSADDPFIKSLYLMVFCFISTMVLRLFFNTKNSITIIIVFGFLIMLHFPMSAVAILLLITYIFLHFLSKYSITYYNFVTYILIFCLTIAIFLHIPGYIQPSGKYFIENIFTYDFSQKMNLIEYSFSYIMIVFFIIGATYTALTRSRIPLSFLVASLIALFIYFVDVPELIRVAGFFAVFGIYIVVLGVLFVSKQLNILIFNNKKMSFALALLLISAISLISEPMLSFVNYRVSASAEETGVSTFTYADYNVSLWIKNNVPNALIISDPWTQFVLGGISGADIIYTRSGNVHSNLTQNIKKIIVTPRSDEAYDIITHILAQNISPDLSKIKKDDLFQKEDIAPMRTYHFEMNLSKKEPIVVISPLTIECEKGNIRCKWQYVRYVVDKQLNQSDSSIKKFFDPKFFELIYKDDNKIYVFRIKHLNEQSELTHKTNQSNNFKENTK